MLEQLENNPSAGALSWLLELELTNNPSVLNAMVANVFRMVPGLRDAQFVIDSRNKKLLIYLELTTWNRWFRKREVGAEVLELFNQVLPSFAKRVVFDKTILNKAIKLAKGNEVKELGNGSNKKA